MKKTILIATIITIFANCINAQNNDKNVQDRDQFHFGIKAGANYSNLYDIKGQDFTADYKFGFAGGIFISIPIGNYFGIQPEVLYSQKGYESSGSILGASYKITHSADYIDLPILLQIKPSEFLTIVAGPQYSYLISTKNKFNSSLLSAQQQQDFDNINIRKNIFGVTGGLDFNIMNVVIGTRVGWDLMHNNGDGTSTSPRYRNMWYQATLGFRF
jgi:hypothetical protein